MPRGQGGGPKTAGGNARSSRNAVGATVSGAVEKGIAHSSKVAQARIRESVHDPMAPLDWHFRTANTALSTRPSLVAQLRDSSRRSPSRRSPRPRCVHRSP